MSKMTVIKSLQPAKLGKRYELDESRAVRKSVSANVSVGKAMALNIDDAKGLLKVLMRACEKSDLALMSGSFVGAKENVGVQLVTENELAKLLKCNLKEAPGGVQEIAGERYVARLKRGIEPSEWILIDADNPVGIPQKWAVLSLQQRLEMLEPLVAGISTCTRVEYRSSSARVVRDGEKLGGATHAWIQISDPAKIEILREHVRVYMQLQGLSFLSPRYSKEPRQVIGHEQRTLIDLAVWVPGRLVFCSKPEVSIEGYHVVDAGVRVFNENGGALDVSWVVAPNDTLLKSLFEKTGQKLSYSSNGSSLVVRDHSTLKWDTPVEIQKVTYPLREVIDKMKPGEKLRCETPFRGSSTEAAFIRLLKDGLPMLFDIGTNTTYFLSENNELERESRDDAPADLNRATWVDRFNAQYAWVEAPKSIFRFDFGDFIKRPELTMQYKNDPIIAQDHDGKEKRICRVTEWIGHKDRAQYYDLVFAPGEPSITLNNEINTWKGFSTAPIQGTIGPYEVLRDHLFPDLNERRYIEQWLAHKLKDPGVKMNTALMVWSVAEGVGKNIFFETINEIIGTKHACVIGQKDLLANFNPWAKNRIFILGDEVLSASNRQAADQLKSLITGTTLRINEKNQPEYEIANYASFVFLSNHNDAVHIESGNRRFFVSEIKAQPLPAKFYENYAHWRDNGGLAALHYFLVNGVDLTSFNPKAPAPLTDAKKAMTSAGRSGLEQWMSDMFEDPIGSFGGTVITAGMLKDSYELSTGDDRSAIKAVSNAATKAGAQARPSQIRLTGGRKVRVMSLADHDAWFARSEAEWAAEFERVKNTVLANR